jgi:subfamily B ATP-binding cassette protein MsbA
MPGRSTRMPKLPLGVFSDSGARSLIRRVLRENFRTYVGRYLLAFLLMGCTAAATGASVFLMKNITQVVFGSPAPDIIESSANRGAALPGTWDDRALDWIGGIARHLYAPSDPGLVRLFAVSLAIIFVFLVKGLSQYGSSVILARIGNNIIARQQERIGRHVLGQSLAFFVRYPSSDLITRTSQAASSASMVMGLLMMRVQDFFTSAALLFAMFKLDWRLSCGALFVMAPVLLLLGNIVKRIRKVAASQYQGLIHVVSAIQEAILGNKLIKTYNLEGHMNERFREAVGGVEKMANKMAAVSARTSPAMEFMGGLAVACIVFYGGYRNLATGQGADSLIAFLTALLLAYEPIKRIARMNVQLQASLVGVGMLYDVLDTDHSIPDAPGAPPLAVREGGIRLEDVSFSYRPGVPVVRNVSLECEGGSVTALVGPSGSGKSTLLNLIERFYEADCGTIHIDGQDIRSVTTASLRTNLSLVSQDTFLFSDTIRNNIRFARPSASDAEVEAAARAAFAHEFILEQPQGYETQVGENGGQLSGGQRQRISIARAFLKNAPILLLDEATSALDSESEQQIQQAFDRLMKGRTTVVIAHRFSTIRNARTIHVMRDGRLVASGSHEVLMRDSEGLYASLHRLQYGPSGSVGT